MVGRDVVSSVCSCRGIAVFSRELCDDKACRMVAVDCADFSEMSGCIGSSRSRGGVERREGEVGEDVGTEGDPGMTTVQWDAESSGVLVLGAEAADAALPVLVVFASSSSSRYTTSIYPEGGRG